ncbi:hypothetical protein C8R43DRAFT_948702 [Mycena crocata]|nr:hypothetical protein C8R43DRAFT_948702 [Mycena crocata]
MEGRELAPGKADPWEQVEIEVGRRETRGYNSEDVLVPEHVEAAVRRMNQYGIPARWNCCEMIGSSVNKPTSLPARRATLLGAFMRALCTVMYWRSASSSRQCTLPSSKFQEVIGCHGQRQKMGFVQTSQTSSPVCVESGQKVLRSRIPPRILTVTEPVALLANRSLSLEWHPDGSIAHGSAAARELGRLLRNAYPFEALFLSPAPGGSRIKKSAFGSCLIPLPITGNNVEQRPAALSLLFFTQGVILSRIRVASFLGSLFLSATAAAS